MDEKPLYGGQAVIEGVMMRGRHFVSCAVRDPAGKIVITSEPLSKAIYESRWVKIPFLRAVTVLCDTLVLGTKMLLYSANVAVTEEPEPGKDAPAESGLPMGVAIGTLVFSLAFGIGLFFVLPLFLVSLIDPWLATLITQPDALALTSNIVEGVIRLAIFLIYLVTISQMSDIRRVFMYHGAEHKTIAADEAGEPLTPDSIRRFSKAHPRCGTGFLLVVVVVSIFVFALFGQPPIVIRMLSRIVLVPVVAALAYELIKFSSAHRTNPLLKWLVINPSLALQGLTTREPDDNMILVAVAALRHVQAQEAAPVASQA